MENDRCILEHPLMAESGEATEERGRSIGAVVRVELEFLPEGVRARRLTGGPRPLTAGVLYRRRPGPNPLMRTLIERARARFVELAGDGESESVT